MVTEKRRIVVNTLVNGAAQFAAMFAALLLMPLLIRSFGLRDYGVYVIATSVGAYATLLDLGVGAALVKMIAERAARGRREEIAGLYATALVFYAVVGVVVALVLAAVAVEPGAIFRVEPDGARLLRVLLLATAVASILSWPLNAGTYVLHGHQRYALAARTALLVLLGNAAVALVVVATHARPLALVVGQSLVLIAGGATNTFVARRLIGAPVSPRRASLASFRAIASFSWVVFVLQVCTLVIFEQTDRLVVGVFIGAAAVTLYEAAGKFQGLVVQLTAFSNSAVIPAASHLESTGQGAELQALFLRGTKYALAFVLPFVVTLIVLAGPVIGTWLGPAFVGQTLAAQVFLLHQVFTPGTAVGDNIVVGLGRTRPRLPYVIWILTVGNLVLSLALVGRLGILGVVLGTVIPHFVDYPLHARFLLRELRVPLRTALRQVALPVYPALVVPIGVALALRTTALMNHLVGVALAGALSVGAYWLALARFGLDATERAELRAVLASVRARLRATPGD
jgi:O-antigen/teichoic acid export membrane protein